MFHHIINHHPVGLERAKPVFHIALLEHGQSAEDETGGLHLDLHDTGEAETGETLFALVRDKAHHGPGEGQGAIFPPLLTVDVIGAGPAVDRNVPAHFGRRCTKSPATGTDRIQYEHHSYHTHANTDPVLILSYVTS